MAARVTPRGWHLQFYTPGTVVRDLLPFLADFEDTCVIDHMGYMTESDPDFERRLLAVLAQGSCWIKLSGAYRVAKHKPLSSVAPWGKALVTARPDRLIWGSDWPHLPDGQRDTGQILNLLADWALTEEALLSVTAWLRVSLRACIQVGGSHQPPVKDRGQLGCRCFRSLPTI
jgi:2-pyrone-4,6-dicarboxylate lactonase